MQLCRCIKGDTGRSAGVSVKIFVMTHKKFNEPEDKIYIPLQVGRATGFRVFGR